MRGHSGVRRSGKTFNSRSFPIIPLVDAGDGGSTPILAWIPAFAGMTGTGGRDARFPPFAGTMRGHSGVRRSGKLLIRFHFLPFPVIPLVDAGGGLHPHQGLDSSLRWNDGDRGQGCEVPVCTGTTGSHSGVRRSGKTFNFRPFPLISDHSSRRMRAGGFTLIRAWIPAFAGMTGTGDRDARFPPTQGATEGGLIPGPIWPCLASFTPTVEAGNEATVASFGPPVTRRHWASVASLWLCLASSGVARSGETFNSVAFGCISLHSYRLRGAGIRGSRLHGNDGGERRM